MAGSGQRGAALIITLAFMVLLAGLLIIFVTQALSYRQQSNNSFNDFKSATLAQSALETVVGDLRQEITNGSTATTYGSGTNISYLYLPTGNTNAVPQRSGNPALIGTFDPVPNLIRVSVRTETYAAGSPAVSSRASAASSTNAANGGQYVSMARWNKHYLIPRDPSIYGGANSTIVGTSPTNSFIPPDWVFVTDQGPTVLAAPTTKAIGRYAYAIYDEGGLLDANVVGVPSNTATNTAPHPNPNPNSLPVWGSGLKGSEAFADLSVTNPATAAPMFSQAQINQIVGWRNNATAQPTGTFAGGYTFTAANALTYHDAVLANTNGFLVTSGLSWADPTSGKTDTDQVFTSRQALINFVNASGMPQDSLQYLATFTRALEQPNYAPPVGRPMVQSATNDNTSVSSGKVFGTGNDAWHVDRVSTTPTTNAPSDINPPLPYVRVTTSFTRADGTVAQVGEPLLKERFPLSRLSLFPTNEAAPSAAAAALIYQYFGLTYQAASGTTPAVWLYSHDPNNTTGIDRLAPTSAAPTIGVTVQAREPDFFELLKAAINVGSIGKGGAATQGDNSGVGSPNTGQATYLNPGTVGYIGQARDTLTALQILQIGANIIDQSKADNFPTRIQFAGDPTVPPNIVSGSEDLPYLYRIRNWTAQPAANQYVYLIQPELWDPYSYSSAASSGLGSSGFVPAASTPKVFRVRLEPDPSVPLGGSPVLMTVDYPYQTAPATSLVDDFHAITTFSLNAPNFQNSTVSISSPYATNSVPNPVPMSFRAGELNGNWGFREPTLLAVAALCPTAHINADASTPSATSAASYADINTHTTMTGFSMASWPSTNAQPLSYTGIETQQKYEVDPNYSTPSPNTVQPDCMRLYLDYQDPNSTSVWVNYDQQAFSYMNGSASLDSHILANYHTYAAIFAAEDWCHWTRTDPRTQRWCTSYGDSINTIPALSAANNEFFTMRAGATPSLATHLGARADNGFNIYANYFHGPTGYRGDSLGYLAENNVRPAYQPSENAADTDSHQRLMIDSDGVPRRGMAGYVPEPSNNGGNNYSTTTPASGVGLPLYTADNVTSGVGGQGWASRPTILHRPFRSVAELGYVFRDTPWANINFSFPESGDSALLDVFCVNDTSSTYGFVAGRVNLNTRQAPVIAALLSGSLRDKDDSTTPVLSQTMASDIANALVARTTTLATQGPLMSRADLVGTWTNGTSSTTAATTLKTADTFPAAPGTAPINPNNFYGGFSGDIGTVASVNGTSTSLITRQRDSVMRALVDSGTVRTWNVLIDLVAQSGRFPPTAANLNNFVVEGEKHYWLHVAIDRYTGKILDSQLEVVRE